jgi:hypothetical protein
VAEWVHAGVDLVVTLLCLYLSTRSHNSEKVTDEITRIGRVQSEIVGYLRAKFGVDLG